MNAPEGNFRGRRITIPVAMFHLPKDPRCLIVASLLASLCIALSCDRSKPLDQGLGTGQIQIQIEWPAAKVARALYDSLVITVSGGEMQPIREGIAVEGRQEVPWRIENVLVGRRTVEVEVKGRSGEGGQPATLYRAAEEVAVLKDRTQTVALKLGPVGVEVNPGTLVPSADTLVVGDTLRIEVRGATVSHTRPLFQWNWDDGATESWSENGTGVHSYAEKGSYTVGVSIGDSISLADDPGELTLRIEIINPAILELVDADTLRFGEVEIDRSQSLAVAVRNQGDLPGTLAVSVDHAVFQVEAAELTVAPGETAELTVRFAPDREGVFSGTVDLGDLGQVSLSGNGILGNQPPLATAASNAPILVNRVVLLDASGSSDPDGDRLTFTWSQVGGPAVELESAVEQPSFTAVAAGTYQFRLVVGDGQAESAPDTVEVRVLSLVAQTGGEVGPDTVGARLAEGRIGLDGRDSQPREGLAYYWEQVREETELRSEFRAVMQHFVDTSVMGTLSDNESVSADKVSFDPGDGVGLYVFALVVEDVETGLRSAGDTLYVFVRSAVPEVVSVEAPEQATTGQVVTLAGEGRDDLDAELQYRWRGEYAALLSDTTSATPSFAPESKGEYRFFLVGIDGEGQESEPFEVVVVVPNQAPQAVVSGPDTVAVAESVILDGSGRDADGDELSYVWEQIEGPALSLSDLTLATPTFTPLEVGAYTFSLVVNDGEAASVPETLHVFVRSEVPQVVDVEVPEQVTAGQSVVLESRIQDDLDAELQYRWRGEYVELLSNTTSAAPVFASENKGEYRFFLVGVDGEGQESEPFEVVVVVVEAVDSTTPGAGPLSFADPNLTAAVRAAISKPEGDILPADVAGLTSLAASERDIVSLDGIEQLIGLEVLKLDRNQVSDLSPLSDLTALDTLWLYDNEISDISALADLTELTFLDLSVNQIGDISPLSGLTKLTLLDLQVTQISDISYPIQISW